jgi:hypothetical protein
MVDLTVDVQVVMSGVGTGDEAHYESSNRLLRLMRDSDCACLALDDEQLLVNKYRECCGPGFGSRWLAEMLSRDKVRYVRRARIDRGTRTACTERGFVGEDLNRIVRVAAASRSKIVVAHEPHFHARPVQRILRRRLSVQVLTADEAFQHLQRCRTESD